MVKNKGLFIVLEGIDNCGKTTQSKLLEKYFKKKGLKVIQTREPGGTETGEEIREVLIKDRKHIMDPLTQILLFYSARNEFIKSIVKPNINSGSSVITDRFEASSYVYQGLVQGVDKKFIDKLHQKIVIKQKCMPDLYIILDISARISLKRGKNTDKKNQQFIYEKQGIKFMEKLRMGYKKYAAENKSTLIDGTLSQAIIHRKIVELVEKLLG